MPIPLSHLLILDFRGPVVHQVSVLYKLLKKFFLSRFGTTILGVAWVGRQPPAARCSLEPEPTVPTVESHRRFRFRFRTAPGPHSLRVGFGSKFRNRGSWATSCLSQPSESDMAVEESTSSSPAPDPCPICLAPFTQESYLDQCFHKFCYHCIVKWINIVTRGQSGASSSLTCPLCKRENLSIICGYDGTSFQRHYVGKSLGNSEFFSEAHRYRLKCYYTDPGDIADKLHASLYWKFRKYLQQNLFLADWLRREIQAVMQEEDVDIIMHHVIGVIESLRRDWVKKMTVSMETAQAEFRAAVSDAVRPFLTGRTERFVQELELFLASGLNMDAFDKVYIKHFGWKISGYNEKDYDQPLQPNPAQPYLYIFDQDPDEN